MPSENQGKVIIRTIADAAVRERLVVFICGNACKATPDAVRERLARLPLVLAGSIDPVKGERLAATLNAMGAEAVFVPNEAAPSSPLAPPHDIPGSTAPAGPGGQHRGGCPAGGAPSVPRGPRGKTAPPTPEEEKQRIAMACRIVLVYALLACLVAMSSPLFLLFSVPLALYATHRAAALLGVGLWLRWIFLPGSFVPVLNVFILVLLFLQVHLFILRCTTPPGAIRDELATFRFIIRVGFAAFMVIFLLGTANGYLPQSMGDLRESVERLLEKEVARSAKDFPRTVNKELCIDSMTAGPAKRLTFNCTLLNVRGTAVDSTQFHADVRGKIVKDVCGSKEMRYYLNKEVIIAYAFSGNDGCPIITVDVENSDCDR